MAVTQYIGARYVPIFADPVEWSDTKSYEPLTIVTHEGASYTSRQYVPVGIGLDNGDYWVITGNYDAQVEAYRQDVTRLEGEFGELTTGVEREIGEFETSMGERFDAFTAEVGTLIETITDDSGCQCTIGEITNCMYAVLRFPKSVFLASLEPSPATLIPDPDNNNRVSNPVILYDYARRERPFFCSNVTNGVNVIYDGTVYGSTIISADVSGVIARRRGDTELSMFMLESDTALSALADTYDDLTSVWPVIVSGGQRLTPNYYSTYYTTNPFPVFGYNDDYYFIIYTYGRTAKHLGATWYDCQNIAMDAGCDYALIMDGGGSMCGYFGDTLKALTPLMDDGMRWRDAALNLTIDYREGVTKELALFATKATDVISNVISEEFPSSMGGGVNMSSNAVSTFDLSETVAPTAFAIPVMNANGTLTKFLPDTIELTANSPVITFKGRVPFMHFFMNCSLRLPTNQNTGTQSILVHLRRYDNGVRDQNTDLARWRITLNSHDRMMVHVQGIVGEIRPRMYIDENGIRHDVIFKLEVECINNVELSDFGYGIVCA